MSLAQLQSLPMNLTTFPKFLELSLEMQDKIWAQAVSDLPPQTIRMCTSFTDVVHVNTNHAFTASLNTATSPEEYAKTAMKHLRAVTTTFNPMLLACRKSNYVKHLYFTLDLGFSNPGLPGNFDDGALARRSARLPTLIESRALYPSFYRPPVAYSGRSAPTCVFGRLEVDTIYLDVMNEFPNIMTFLGFSRHFLVSPVYQNLVSLQLNWSEFATFGDIRSMHATHYYEDRGHDMKLLIPNLPLARQIGVAVNGSFPTPEDRLRNILQIPKLKHLKLVGGVGTTPWGPDDFLSYAKRTLPGSGISWVAGGHIHRGIPLRWRSPSGQRREVMVSFVDPDDLDESGCAPPGSKMVHLTQGQLRWLEELK